VRRNISLLLSITYFLQIALFVLAQREVEVSLYTCRDFVRKLDRYAMLSPASAFQVFHTVSFTGHAVSVAIPSL
jgi:hypothetical protein